MEFSFISWRSGLRAGLCGSVGLCLIGCQVATQRNGSGDQYTRYVESLYDEPAVNHGPRTIEFPVNVAVAQVGETTPSQDMLGKLAAAHDVIHRVTSLPADIRPADPSPGERPGVGPRGPVPRLQSLARDQGADYLLIYGTSVETRTRVNELSGFDLTIVGAFFVPSRNVEADARASAALIDVRSGTVVFTVGAQARDDVLASAAATDGKADRLQAAVGEKSLLNLADAFIKDARRRNAEDNAVGVNEPVKP